MKDKFRSGTWGGLFSFTCLSGQRDGRHLPTIGLRRSRAMDRGDRGLNRYCIARTMSLGSYRLQFRTTLARFVSGLPGILKHLYRFLNRPAVVPSEVETQASKPVAFYGVRKLIHDLRIHEV